MAEKAKIQPQQVLSLSEKQAKVLAAIFGSFATDDEQVEALRVALSLCSPEDLMQSPPPQAPLALPGGPRFEHK